MIHVSCPAFIEGRVVAARLRIPVEDVPEVVHCQWQNGHQRSHGNEIKGFRIWWWVWGNGRTQMRGKAKDGNGA
jgi:hypothetical protein